MMNTLKHLIVLASCMYIGYEIGFRTGAMAMAEVIDREKHENEEDSQE